MAVKDARRHFPGLEGIRGIACVAVVVNHVAVYTGVINSSLFGAQGKGMIGAIIDRSEVSMPIFFVVSAALLFRPYVLAMLEDSKSPATSPYLWRRALRILPAYWLMTPVALVLLNGSTITGPWPVLRPLLFLQVYQPDALASGMEQTWSLPTEVAFYLLLPVFALLVGRFARKATTVGRRAWRLQVPLVALVVIGLGYTVYTHLPSEGPYPTQFLWLPEYVEFLAVGMIVAVLSVRAELEPSRAGLYTLAMRWPAACWGVALVAFALSLTSIAGPNSVDYPGVSGALVTAILYLICSGFLVAPLTVPDGDSRLVRVVVTNPVSLFLGRISYGIFLWHLIFLDGYYKWSHTRYGTGNFWLVLPLPLFGAIAVATISYYALELPAMRLRPRLGKAPADLSTPVPLTTPEPALSAEPAADRPGVYTGRAAGS